MEIHNLTLIVKVQDNIKNDDDDVILYDQVDVV